MSATVSLDARKPGADAVSPARVLVIGGSPDVLEAILQELHDAGVAAQGTTEAERAATDYDAREFDLISLGGGLRGPLGEELKQRFRARNPAVRLLDTWAPQAVHQIVTALGGAEDGVALDAYFDRIGYRGSREPTLETLRELHRQHLTAIPFEAVDVLMQRGIELSPAAVDAKLIVRRRGGYCFEQNGLFRRVLLALGFQVEGLLARVRWMAPAGAPPAAATHMALRVTLNGEPWLVDVGFGTAVPPEPLRFDTNEPQPTVHETFRLIPFGYSRLLQARISDRWEALYQVLPEPAVAADYEAGNWFTSTHPSSIFRQMLTVARTTPDARHALRDHRLTVRRVDGHVEQHFLDADGIERALRETFDLPVTDEWRPVIEQAAVRGAQERV